MSRQAIIDKAASQDGIKESPANSNKTAYGKWYGLDGVKWCAIFVSWVYDHAGHHLEHVDTVNGYQSCQSGYNFWKRKGRFTKEPQPADIVLYDWTGDGVCDHTGIFVKWLDGAKTTFQAWEGNTEKGNNSNGGKVMLRERKRFIVRAFVTPLALSDASPISHDEILERGDSGSEVTIIQKMLHDLGYTLTVDGIFGLKTENIIKEFQQKHSLEITGKVTPQLKGLIEEEVNLPDISRRRFTTGSYLRKGDSGNAVLTIQRALNAHGANPAIAENGVFSSSTLSAVKNFQQQKNLIVDGVVGPQTIAALEIADI